MGGIRLMLMMKEKMNRVIYIYIEGGTIAKWEGLRR